MSNSPNVRNVNPDKPDKAPDVAHGAPGQAHSSGAIGHDGYHSSARRDWLIKQGYSVSQAVVKVLEEERDYYQAECERLRSYVAAVASGMSREDLLEIERSLNG